MADIFISYSSKDKEKADQLSELLASAGFSVWIDRQRIDVATSWSKEIADALEECTTFIILISPRSIASVNVAKELSIAAKLGKRIVPVRLERVDLKGEFLYHLTSLQHVDHTNVEGILRGLNGGTDAAKTQRAGPIIIDEAVTNTIRIAVLPFEDQSPDQDHGWFSDGLTDELITTLNKLDALFVLDRRSSQVYKQAKLTVKQIAHELDVQYLVTGAVRKAAAKLRIQASLVEATSGATLWDEKFTGTMDDIFEIQERTALDICQGLELTLTKEEVAEIEDRGTENVEAYELLLRSTGAGSTSMEAMLERLEMLKRAVLLDPKYAAAYAAIAVLCANYRRTGRHDAAMLQLQEETTQKAVELAPGSRFAYLALSNLHSVRGEAEKAIETAKKMVTASPKRAIGYGVVGFMYLESGQYIEATRWISKAIEIDQNSFNDYANLFSCYLKLNDMQGMLRTLNQAAPRFEQYLALNPDDQPVRVSYAMMLESSDHHSESIREIQRLLSLPNVHGSSFYLAAAIYARQGNTETAVELLRSAAKMGVFNSSDMRDDVDFWANIHALPDYRVLFAELELTASMNNG